MGRAVKYVAAATAVLGVCLTAASPALAVPAFSTSFADQVEPFRVGDQGSSFVATVRNIGTDPGVAPTTVHVTTPPGITLRRLTTATIGFVCDTAAAECVRSTAWPVNQAVAISARFSIDAATPGDATFEVNTSGGGADPTAASHDIQIEPFRPFGVHDFTAGAFDDLGDDYTQAGGEPYEASTRFFFNRNTARNGLYEPVENVRRLITELPVGFYGNPKAVEECTEVQLVSFLCPPEAQVGFAEVDIRGAESSIPPGRAGVYRIKPQPGHAAEFGFSLAGVGTVYLFASVRSDSDYGIDITAPSSPSAPRVQSAMVTLWGRPADPRHDALRCANLSFPCPGVPSTAPPMRFLTNPSECTGLPAVTVLKIDSWQNMGDFKAFEASAPPVTGCDQLTFEPSAHIAPTTGLPDAPTGLDVDLDFPTEDNGAGLAPPPLKKAVVTLPEGMSINPSAAGGLAACTDEQLNLKKKSEMSCPDAAKIGEVTATTPLLDETLSGGVFIRSQNSDDPESGEMFRLALVLENEERGLSIRLPGQVRVSKDTGRIEATFDNNPQLPVDQVDVSFKSGPRAPLATPSTCGEKTIDTVLTSWGGQTVERTSTFNVDCTAGLGGFAPAFDAGAVNPVAGVFSPFAVNIAKPDGDSALDGVSLKLPTGLLAKIKGNLNTQVGSVKAFAGPGSQPFMLPGTVTLEGAYGDAPYSLRVVVPAKAGPFDLGDVVVRQKVYVDPVTAQVSVVSDPVPTIVKGVPARMQRLEVLVDKPGFMVNPTSCEAKEITGTLDSLAGQTAAVKTRFQVGECAKLPFKPRLAMRLTGPKQVTTGKHPGVKAQVNQAGAGEAGIQKAVVRLPKSLALDPENAQALCEFEDGTKPDLENHCPKGSIVGRARAQTPLLERDLVGNVYFVKNVRTDPKTGNTIRTLPMIVVALRGEIAINLKGESSTTKAGKLVNTFNNVPDAPISQFNLNVAGGKNGILAVTRTRKSKINVCASRQIAETDMDGQNGRTRDFNVRIKTPCTKRQTKAAKRKANKAGGKSRNR
jgi:hypothetical protein